MNVLLSPQHGLCQLFGRIQLVEIRTQATHKTAQLLHSHYVGEKLR